MKLSGSSGQKKRSQPALMYKPPDTKRYHEKRHLPATQD